MRVLALLLAVFALVNSQSESFCAFDLRDIEVHINESMNGVVTDFFLNCLAQNGSHFAESISLSAFTSVDQGVRYDFQCYEGSTLIPTISMNVSIVYNHACSSCNFSLVDDPCEGSGEQSDYQGLCEYVSLQSVLTTVARVLITLRHARHVGTWLVTMITVSVLRIHHVKRWDLKWVKQAVVSMCLCTVCLWTVLHTDYHPDYTRLVHVGYVRKRKSGNNKYQKGFCTIEYWNCDTC